MEDPRLRWRPLEEFIQVALLTIGIALLVVVVQDFSHQQNIPLWVLLVIGAICMFVAAFVAGKHATEDEQRRAIEPILREIDSLIAKKTLAEATNKALRIEAEKLKEELGRLGRQ